MKILKEEYKSPFGSFWSTMILNYFRNGMKRKDVKDISKIATDLKMQARFFHPRRFKLTLREIKEIKEILST